MMHVFYLYGKNNTFMQVWWRILESGIPSPPVQSSFQEKANYGPGAEPLKAEAFL